MQFGNLKKNPTSAHVVGVLGLGGADGGRLDQGLELLFVLPPELDDLFRLLVLLLAPFIRVRENAQTLRCAVCKNGTENEQLFEKFEFRVRRYFQSGDIYSPFVYYCFV